MTKDGGRLAAARRIFNFRSLETATDKRNG
jgi:hypothetical protein